MSESMPAIEANGLTKVYGSFYAIRDVTFQIPRGQVAAFLGPNGAGKSTTMKVLTGYMAPSAGHARIMGMEVTGNRAWIARSVGYLPENGPLYADATPRELLRFLGRARGLSGPMLNERIEQVIRQCRLEEVVGRPIGKLSRGYRQRVGMAHVLLHEPDVLIMDEPTAGLDPNQIHEVRQTIRELGKHKTILLSTHILQEVQAVAERIIFINQGRIVFDGSVREFGSNEREMDERFAELTTGHRQPALA